jgi:hypothetical protein
MNQIVPEKPQGGNLGYREFIVAPQVPQRFRDLRVTMNAE